MKTVTLTKLTIGIMLNAFSTPIAQELFDFKGLLAETGGKGSKFDLVYLCCFQGC